MTVASEKKIVEVLSEVMASGALFFAANLNQMQGSRRSFPEHFANAAENFLHFRPDLLNELCVALTIESAQAVTESDAHQTSPRGPR